MEPLILIDKEIETKFAKLIVDMDFDQLANLLDDNGEFNIQDNDLQTIDVNKEQFLSWIINKRKKVSTLEYYFDQCLYCRIGNPVIMFNNGDFPREIFDSSEKSKTGLMINVKDNKINVVQFCYTLLNTENRYQFEIHASVVKEYMGDNFKNCSVEEYVAAHNECKRMGLIKCLKGDKD